MSRPAFPHDDTMPGIPLAVDPAAMLAMFADELRRESGADYAIDDCRLLRIRYRPAEHCYVQYSVGLVEVRTGRRNQIWLSGQIHPDDRPRRRLKKLLAACVEEPDTEGWRAFDPAFYLSAANMLVQAFPCDRRLPTLSRVVGRPERELESILLSAFRHGDWQIEHCDVEPVRYRALLGAVLRYSVEARDAATGRRAHRTLYVKVYKGAQGETACRVLSEIRHRAEASGEPFSVVKPIGYSSRLRALVLEHVPGISLYQMILEGIDVEHGARQTARALAAFHRNAQINALVSARCRSPIDVLAKLKAAENYVIWAFPHLASDLELIRRAVDAGLKQAICGPAHLDIKAEHVVLDGERVVFLDLDSFGEGDPVYDAAAMPTRLAVMSDLYDVPSCRTDAAARAFTDEYFAHVPDDWRDRLPVNYACVALRVASEIFRLQHPRWRELVPAWIVRARNAATEGIGI